MMHWEYAISCYTEEHCAARGLASGTIKAYADVLGQFRQYVLFHLDDKLPQQVSSRDVLDYIRHLRQDRHNGDSSVNRTVTILKNFYRALVAMDIIDPLCNPMAGFPRIKSAPVRVPKTLNEEEIDKIIGSFPTDTVIGLRDRAIFVLLYATGIRVSECSGLRECDVDFVAATITVTGKGGHQRVICIQQDVLNALKVYRTARGLHAPYKAFFISMRGNGMSRNAIYERVRTAARRARICKAVSPHWLRHTCATELVREGVNIVTIQHLLGHRCLSSTQVYMHVGGESLKQAAEKHPIRRFGPIADDLLPNVKLPFRRPKFRCRSG